ncbi:androgen-induced gene 1 protein isoform X2 [Lampetra fluviatilis]
MMFRLCGEFVCMSGAPGNYQAASWQSRGHRWCIRQPSQSIHGTCRGRSRDLLSAGAFHTSRGLEVIQTCFFAVAVLGDASKFLHKGGSGLAMDQQLTKLTRLRDRIFTVLAFPIGTFVVIAFWAMYSWDREMVHPQVLDSFIPAWLHHGMHSTVLLFLLLEILMTPHRYPSRAMGLLGTILFSVAYVGWVLWVQQAAGISVYPLLARLARPVLGALLALAVLAVGCLYVAGEKLDSFVWGREEVISKSD